MNKSFPTPVQDENLWIFLLLSFFYKYFHKLFMVSWKVINACFTQWKSTVSMCSPREACVIILFNYVQDTYICIYTYFIQFFTSWQNENSIICILLFYRKVWTYRRIFFHKCYKKSKYKYMIFIMPSPHIIRFQMFRTWLLWWNRNYFHAAQYFHL